MFKEFTESLRKMFRNDDVFWNNEVQANKLVTVVIAICIILLITGYVLHVMGIFPMDPKLLLPVIVQGLAELSIPLILSLYFRQERWWLKLVLMLSLTIAMARADMVLSYKVPLLMTIPVILSSRYFSRSLTKFIAILTVILFTLSTIASVSVGVTDLNVVSMPMGTVITVISRFLGASVRAVGIDKDMLLTNTLLYSYLPKLLTYFIVAVISMNIAERGRAMVLEQDAITKKTSRIDSELSLARDIQKDMLPNEFPVFTDHDEFDLHAIMTPAREVGGDYYDFLMTDDSHLLVIMADVSGKSIPASLFMVIAKTLMKNQAREHNSPSQIMHNVNNALCEGNKTGLFVTAWLGILNINDGTMVYANAGHTPPVLVRNGQPEILKCRPNFILGGMEDMEYPEASLKLNKGDIIYLYTDGVTEAENTENELYGTERLLETIRKNDYGDMKEFCEKIEKDIHEFENGNEQFDDLTMLALRYAGTDENTIRTEAVVTNIEKITDFVNERLEAHDVPIKAQMQIDVVIDELVSNVTKFAYPGSTGDISVSVDIKDDAVSLTFKDSGIPFNPLLLTDPDVNAPIEKRQIGGLGLFLVRKTMDDIKYEYTNGYNILTVTKNL